jgi:Flp pilus assembly protein TadG
MKRCAFDREESGQALVVVALAMVVLMGALAFSIDWGYSLVTRRAAQNGADAAALVAGRHLASTYVGGLSTFDTTQEQLWCEARDARDANAGSAPVNTNRSLTISLSDIDNVTLAEIKDGDVADCAAVGALQIPAATRYVQVNVAASYRSLFGAFAGQSDLEAGAGARVLLAGVAIPCGATTCVGIGPLNIPAVEVPGAGISGDTTRPNVAIWPLAIHYKALVADMAVAGRCGQYCDASLVTPITLWPRNRSPLTERYGTSDEFTGLISFAHFSLREAGQVHQLSTESDYTGTNDSGVATAHNHLPITGQMTNADPGRFCGGAPTWDTLGAPSLSLAASCDLPNWFAWGFRGSIGLGTNWDPSASWDDFETSPGRVEVPAPLARDRSSCAGSSPLPRPSCTGADSLLGDWIETVPGDLTRSMAGQMLEFVQRYGRVVPKNAGLGKALVVRIPVWDCAERFDGAGSDHWSLMVPRDVGGGSSTDCAELEQSDPTVDRIHIVSLIPFTIYEDLIRTVGNPSVKGYWGDVFGDASRCAPNPAAAGCDLNPLMNSAFLVPDE